MSVLVVAMAAVTIWVELQHRKEEKIRKKLLEKFEDQEQEKQKS